MSILATGPEPGQGRDRRRKIEIQRERERFQDISSLSLEGVMEMRCGGWSWGLRVSLSDPASSLTLSELLQRPQVTLFPYLAKITAKRHRSGPSSCRRAAVIELKLQGDEDKWCLRLETHPGGLISPQWIGEMTFRRLSVWNHNNNNPFSDRTQKGKLRIISIYGGLIMVHQ